MENEIEIKGIGGWLILVGLGIIISPIIMLTSFATFYFEMIQNGSWSMFIEEILHKSHPMLRPFLFGEIIINWCLFLVSLIQIYLFFSKNYYFPKLYIGIVIVTIIIIPIDLWFGSQIFPGVSPLNTEMLKEFVRTLISGLIWVPYMLFSKRVKATFTKNA